MHLLLLQVRQIEQTTGCSNISLPIPISYIKKEYYKPTSFITIYNCDKRKTSNIELPTIIKVRFCNIFLNNKCVLFIFLNMPINLSYITID